MEERKMTPLAKFMVVLAVLAFICVAVDLYQNFEDYSAAYKAGYAAYDLPNPFD
ncbi:MULTISPECIES: hypothetical protein [Aerococcus]|uniref:hypothetical protein n=1 Tax=Aerococcus TaxID=1375 RepID=UPI00143A0011|nr:MULTISPECIES: hypothetical protein [Aerococcus]MDK6369258.1 hypothetical protein [Aerococcus sp. UMB9870]MDK6679082.1 hypothetical protein [Aerococcus sp. UMB8608]MDK6686989.1 hypothetical protein [Aerococcus sp. UMB8623]MDK6940145.1 hypothetical protein [Aerococcus sp. UMB8487]